MKKKTFLLAIAASVALFVSSCTAAVPETISPVQSPGPEGFESYYQQQIEFEKCGRKLSCAEIAVPMNWKDPSSEAITIAVIYRKAEKNDAPFLLFNPGGPGASGYDWVAESAEFIGSPRLRENFNILGFDPRGVGRSSAIRCLSDSEYDEFLYGVSGYPLFSAADLEESKSAIEEFSQKCLENTGPLLGFVDTVSAARDMDVIRSVLGSEELNFLGYSYGSFLGTTYATLYPDRVGKMVLDGAIDPTAPDNEQTRFQIEAFENSLRAFLQDCEQFADCPFSGNLETDLIAVADFLAGLESTPLPTDTGRELTIWAAITGLIMPLYSENYWPVLATAFDEAFLGTGNTFLALADLYNDRSDDGRYTTNLIAANYAINCLDSRSDSSTQAMLEENERLLEVAPTLGRYWKFGALRCASWPVPLAERPADYNAKGSAKILVVGTTGDPATPYSQAVALANEILDNAFLLSYDGEGHTIYGQQFPCIDDVVDAYLLRGELPAEDPFCKG